MTSMRALREVGPIIRAWLEELVAAPRPWAIETLDVDVSDPGMFEMLRDTTALPALRHLIIRGDFSEQSVHSLVRAAWGPQLARLTIIDGLKAPHTWQARQARLGVPWLAIRTVCTEPVRADGWELAFGPDRACEVTLRGFLFVGSCVVLLLLLVALFGR